MVDGAQNTSKQTFLFSGQRLVNKLVRWAESTTKDYIRAEHKLHSISKSFISQVITPQVTSGRDLSYWNWTCPETREGRMDMGHAVSKSGEVEEILAHDAGRVLDCSQSDGLYVVIRSYERCGLTLTWSWKFLELLPSMRAASWKRSRPSTDEEEEGGGVVSRQLDSNVPSSLQDHLQTNTVANQYTSKLFFLFFPV